MLQVGFPCIEIMFILPRVVATIVLLYYLGSLLEEFGLFVLIFVDFPMHELATANEAAPDALDPLSGF